MTGQFGEDSDRSSEASDRNADVVDSQPWESGQIPSVEPLGTSVDSSGSEFIWIEDSETTNIAQHPIEPNISNGSTQLVRADRSSRSAVSTQQKNRGKFQDQTLRTETSRTRKLKACVRCRMQKIRCEIDENDPEGTCKTCQTVTNQRLYTLPCARYKITECTLYRTGKAPGLEFTFRWPVMKLKDINKWAGTEVREIQLQSDVCEIPFTVSARRFLPIAQDSLKRGWMDGKIKKFKDTTPFAIVNMASAVKDMKEYIDKNVLGCMKYFLQDTGTLVKETYDFAVKHMERHRVNLNQGLLMGNFMRLWFAVRRTHTTEHIVGGDTLDMRPETVDKSFPLFGKVPLPPVMIQQLDMILTLGVLQPLRKKVLEDLQKLILSNKPSTWMTVYLITFMSMHSCARISNENYKNARKHGLKRRYAMPAFVQERHHAANVFLSHYHYRTQPCDPFKLDWRRRHATPFAAMSEKEVMFLMRTKELVEQKRDDFRIAKDIGLYEHELYFISQMYEDDWQPREIAIDFDEGTINDVPLREYV
ncbi:hypothetical protein NA57DRAFT_49246 [Rhizodiscina lignyota]|uniref:Zn(2)-C6 fungal-type domain-containing protein n=1 Tax=Rhizodiscina lignyota TaxID=1504668 RepID=A0A9P4I0W0_9PEZI|nr:hypothetical protein NA57DRAFT_49246 [Rhizodiscina lignyota]